MRKTTAAIILFLAIAVALFFMWTGFADELRKMKPVDGFDTFLSKKDICTVAFADDKVWAGGTDGLFVSAGGDFTEIGDFLQVKALLADGDRIWTGHDEGLTLITGEGMSTITSADGLPDDRVNALAFGPDGTLWAGTWGGAALITQGKVRAVLTSSDGLTDDMVNVIYKDSDENIWIGSYVAPRGGVTVIKGAEKHRFSTANGLLHSNINAIIEISEGLVLTGGGLYTKGGGTLFSKSDAGWVIAGTMTTEDGLAGEKVRSLFIDSSGSLWAGSEYDGLAVFKDLRSDTAGGLSYSDSEILTVDSGLPNNEVKVIAQAEDGSIWIGTRSGLLKIDKGGIDNVWGSG